MKEEGEGGTTWCGRTGAGTKRNTVSLWVFLLRFDFFFLSLQFSTFSPMTWEDDGGGGGLTAWCGRGLRSVDDVVTASTTASTSHDCTAEKKRHLHTLATQKHTNERMPPDERRKNKERRRKKDFVTSLLLRHMTVKPAFPSDAALRRWPWRERCVVRAGPWYGVAVARNDFHLSTGAS